VQLVIGIIDELKFVLLH